MEQKEVNANSSSPNPAEEDGDHTFRQSSGVSSGIYEVDNFLKAPLLAKPFPSPIFRGAFITVEVIQKSPSSASPGLDEEAYLLKVPHQLRQVKESAYEPQLISIGPYHHGKQHLIEMEVYKKRCLQRILDRKGEQSEHRYLEAIDSERARKWYSPSLSKDIIEKLDDIMLLDGCFIVELLRQMIEGKYDDPIFRKAWVANALFVDFLLFENQLPFFVLLALHRVIKDPSDERDFASHAFSVLSNFLPKPKKWENPPTIKDPGNIKHLLSLVHDNWAPSQGIKGDLDDNGTKEEKPKAGKESGLKKWRFPFCAVEKPKENKSQGDVESGVTKEADHNSSKWKFICCARERKNVKGDPAELHPLRCATELKEAGIHFVNSTKESDVNSLFDISFTDATMKIPTFMVDDNTDRLFRNLTAYELYKEGSTYVIDYVTLMDNLINSSKDVQLLRLSGIIKNLLGDDEAVAEMLNKLGDHVTFSSDNFYYREIYFNVKTHCERRWNTWKAKLRHDYFNSPWALVSFIAALLVILLTIGSFITAVISLVK